MGREAVIDLDAYNRDGFVLLRDFFQPSQVHEVLDAAKRIFIAQMRRTGVLGHDNPSDPEFEQGMADLFEADIRAFTNCGKHAQHTMALHRLSLHGSVVDKLREFGLTFPNICTRPVLLFNSQRLAKEEVYWRLAVHQDWRSMQGSLDSMVVWVPLVDVDAALGALEIVPGSHRGGLLNADFGFGYGRINEAVDEKDFVSVEVKRGDALFFSTFLVHRSGTNVTESIRWSCHFRYNNMADPTFIERGFPHPYIYKPMDELITPDFPQEGDLDAVFGGARSSVS